MINRNTITKCRIYDEKYRTWVNEPLTIYPGEPIVKQGHVIQWFTGVVDKNKREIYEGDIVKTVDGGISSLSINYVTYTRGVITWLREAFCVCQSYVGGNELSNYVRCYCCPADLEIIGNIFDNPELLEDDPEMKQMSEEGKN